MTTNWGGNHRYRAARVHRPTSLEQLRRLAAGTPRLRVLGSRHSFSGIADSDALVALDALPAEIHVDRDAGTVACSGAVRYGDLARVLDAKGLALHNLASLPHISVAGAVATATHGSGDANGNLATAVAGLELMTSAGDVVEAARGERDFDGMVVGLGALGAVTRVTLDVEPAYAVRQRVFDDLPWEALADHFDAIMGSGDSVSVFTRLRDVVDMVWVKTRVDEGPEEVRDELFGATPAPVDRHPLVGADAVNCTGQLGRPGPWWDRWPHFRMGFTPSRGDEIQSEYFVARRHALDAVAALRGLAHMLRPVLQVCELRTIAADRLWMSPQQGQGTVGLHFTWRLAPAAVADVLPELEAALARFEARPHWGKLFDAGAEALAPLYPRHAEFAALAERLDPRGAFRNDWLARRVPGLPA